VLPDPISRVPGALDEHALPGTSDIKREGYSHFPPRVGGSSRHHLTAWLSHVRPHDGMHR
jgi:hypothetical protein